MMGALIGCVANRPRTSATGLILKSCSADGQQARCGTLMVAEDRLTGDGRRIPSGWS
jgi:hypothetical protein